MLRKIEILVSSLFRNTLGKKQAHQI